MEQYTDKLPEAKISHTPVQFAFENRVVNEETTEYARMKVAEAYDKIIEFYKRYTDLKEEYYHIIAIWLIGTYVHKQFNTYPFLFFNAMRGSGKTRTIKITSYIQKGGDGTVLNNPSESVIFRTAEKQGLVFDEFEHIGSKDIKH